MAEIPIPAGLGVPLVDMTTKLFPAPTMAALDARYAASTEPIPEPEPEEPAVQLISWVDVVTGDEPRPNALHVIWKGGSAQPANMTVADLHFRVAAPVEEPEEPEEPTDPEPITGKSVFGSVLPSGLTALSDGGGVLEVGTRFYATKPIEVIGARIAIPAGVSGKWLTDAITLRVWTEDWPGSDGLPSALPATTPTRVAVVPGGRTAGTWAEVLFSSPVLIGGIGAGLNGADVITIAAKLDGTLYASAPVGMDSISSPEDSAVHLAEALFRRAVSNVTISGETYYGIDIIFRDPA